MTPAPRPRGGVPRRAPGASLGGGRCAGAAAGTWQYHGTITGGMVSYCWCGRAAAGRQKHRQKHRRKQRRKQRRNCGGATPGSPQEQRAAPPAGHLRTYKKGSRCAPAPARVYSSRAAAAAALYAVAPSVAPPRAAPTPCAAPNRQTTGADSPSAADRRSGAVCRCAGDAPALYRSRTCTTAPCTTGPAPPPPVAPHPGRLPRHSAPVASPPRHSCLRIASPRRRWPRPQSTAGQAVKSPGNAIETP